MFNISMSSLEREEQVYPLFIQCLQNTLPETNVAPENRPSQKEISIPTSHFQVFLLLVSGRVHLFDACIETARIKKKNA